VARAEASAIRAYRPNSLNQRPMLSLKVTQAGSCTFLSDEARCSIWALPIKPRTCDRYPYTLVSTPEGGRISTDHRCPCRSMGERASLDAEHVRAALLDGAGRLSVDRRVEDDVPFRDGARLRFSEWRRIEEQIMARLTFGESPREVLGVQPFSMWKREHWLEFARTLAAHSPGARWVSALRWSAHAIFARLDSEHVWPELERPWLDVFDRAQARSPQIASEGAILSDWLLDQVWSLEWASSGDWTLATHDWGTRLAMAEALRARFVQLGARADRAEAEALCVIEILGFTDAWTSLRDAWTRPSAR
jgi:hypothetical protein